jgi:succinate-acetate transporter protein
MSILAFTTAVLSCVYAGFIIPFGVSGGTRTVVGALLFIGGIVQILAGMWEFRKDNTLAATLFTAYGAFITTVGLVFIIAAGAALANLSNVLGLLFLCWTIFNAVLIAGALRTSTALLAALGLLFIAFAFMTIGHLAGFNGVLLRIGGWIGIITALVAWYVSLASLTREENLPLPTGPEPMR